MALIRLVLPDRLAAQLIAGPPSRDPVAVAERVLAVQAQDRLGVRLAIRVRSQSLSAADVDRALTRDRTLVVTWLNRGTLHLVRREDYPWLQALTAPTQLTANARRLRQEGVTTGAAERGVDLVEHSLGEEGPLTRAQLSERLSARGVPTAGQALVHILLLASLRGLVVRGPVVGREQAFVLVRDWLGAPDPVDRGTALAELARRYLAGHGPAGDRDLARWAGLPLRDARAGLRGIASELEHRHDGLVDFAGRATERHVPTARLLGSFDPLLLGWASRAFVVGDHERVVTSGGVLRPVVLVRGRAAGLWRLSAGAVELDPFTQLLSDARAHLAAEADDVVRFLDRTVPSRQEP